MSDSFRRGFLYRLSESGLTPEEFGDTLIKRANGSGFLGLGSGLFDAVAAAALVGPPAVGAGLGTLGYMLTRPDYNTRIKEIQEGELTNTLRQKTREIQRRLLNKGVADGGSSGLGTDGVGAVPNGVAGDPGPDLTA